MRRGGLELVALAALLGVLSGLHLEALTVPRTSARAGRRAITRSTGIARGDLEHDRTDSHCTVESSAAPDLDRPSAPPCLAAEPPIAPSPLLEARSERPTSLAIARPSIEHELPAARAPPLAA